jgi:hypothetical protein
MARESFKFVGVSNLNGKVKVRYTNDKNRAKVLIRNGHTDVEFLGLSFDGFQEDCVSVLLDNNFHTSESYSEAVREAVKSEAKKLGFKV